MYDNNTDLGLTRTIPSKIIKNTLNSISSTKTSFVKPNQKSEGKITFYFKRWNLWNLSDLDRTDSKWSAKVNIAHKVTDISKRFYDNRKLFD